MLKVELLALVEALTEESTGLLKCSDRPLEKVVMIWCVCWAWNVQALVLGNNPGGALGDHCWQCGHENYHGKLPENGPLGDL